MLLGFIAGIPIFVEVGFIVLAPLALVIAINARIPRLKEGLSKVVSLMIGHCIVPLYPVAMSIAALLGGSLGKLILLELVSISCAIVTGHLLIRFAHNNPPSVDFIDPIDTKTTISARGLNLVQLLHFTAKSVHSIAGILRIIGAGGAFSRELTVSGVDNGLKKVLLGLSINSIVLFLLIAALLHFAIGSATVAMISPVETVFPLFLGDSHLKPEIMAMAIGSGAVAITHTTNSYFRLVKDNLGLSITATLKALTLALTIASLAGLFGALLLNMIM